MIGRWSKRIGKLLLVLLAVLVVIVAALPAILSTDAARKAMLERVNAQLGGGILTVADWSFGWRKGVRIEDAAYQDGEGRFGVKVGAVSVSSGLLKLLLSPVKNLGTIEVLAAHGWCDMDRLDAVVAEPKPSGKPVPGAGGAPTPAAPDGGKIPLALDVIAKLLLKDARLEARRAGLPATTLLLDGVVDCASVKKPVTFALTADCRTADLAPPAQSEPGLTLEGSVLLMQDGVFDPAAMVATLTLGAKQFDLAGLSAVRAMVPDMPLVAGTLDGALKVDVQGLGAITAAGNLQLRDLQLTGGALGEDHPRFELITLDVDAVRKGDSVTVKEFALRSTAVTVRASGALAPAPGEKYPRGKVALIADANLAELAAVLPYTLKVPETLRIDRGNLRVDGHIEGSGETLQVRTRATLRDLQGGQGRHGFQLSAPVEAVAVASLEPSGLVIQRVSFESGFASVSGGGNATGALFNVSADLAAAAKEVDQIVDLGALQAGGKLSGVVQLDLQSADARRVAVDLALEKFLLSGLRNRPGMEAVPDMWGDFGATVNVTLGTGGVTTVKGDLQSTGLTLRGGALGADQPRIAPLKLHADLTQVGAKTEIRALGVNASLAAAAISGNVETVAGELYPRMALAASTSVLFAETAAQFTNTLHIKPGIRITEGMLDARGTLRSDGSRLAWDATADVAPVAALRGTQTLRMSAPVTVASRGAVQGKQFALDVLRINSGFAQIDAKGDLAKLDASVKADLDKALAELGQFMDLGKLRVGGQLAATLAVSRRSATDLAVGLDARLDKLVLAGVPMAEPVTLGVSMVRAGKDVSLGRFALGSAPIDVQATGRYAAGDPARPLTLNGSLGSDCTAVAALVSAFAGYKPDMAGKATRDFMLNAPLGAGGGIAVARQAQAKAGLHADHFKQFGVLATDIDLDLTVGDGRAQVTMASGVNGGKLHAAPYLDFRGPGPVLMLPENSKLLESVELNEDMASELLARIHPIFRGCAVNGGELNLTMAQLRAPLGPRLEQETTFNGTVQLTNLRLGPGQGMLGQLLTTLRSDVREVGVSNTVVRFECRDGRVTSSPLVINIESNVAVTLSGSVGLDQTLVYRADVPLTAELVGASVYPYVRGITATIPISGTVSSPRLDTQGLTRAVKQAAAQAGANVLLDQLKKPRGGEAQPAAPEGGAEQEQEPADPTEQLIRGVFDRIKNR